MTIAPEADWRERIDAVRRCIEDRLEEDVPLEVLADVACASVFHFHRVFRGMTGETVRGYGRRLRLERAAHRLTHGDDDILTIALDAGYDSHEAFTRAFRARFGAPPSTFRQERRAVLHARVPDPEEMTMEIHIAERAPTWIASVRHVGPYDQVGEAWKTLMKWGWSKMMFGRAETFGLCFDDPDVTPAERIRYEACMAVKAGTKPKGEVAVRELPGGTYAVAEHVGPYDTLGRTYAGLCAAVAAGPVDGMRWSLGDPPSVEVYLNDPRKTPPEDLRTEVWMPVTRG